MANSSSIFLQLAEYPQWSLLWGKIKIKQHYRYDCGAACLASIAAYYGVHSSLAHIRMACGCTSEGISIQGIIDGAAELGFSAKGLLSREKDIAGLCRVQTPFIAHIKEESGYLHYIAIYGINRKCIKAMDPAEGKLKKIPMHEFIGRWSGYIITIVPDAGLGTNDPAEAEIHLLKRLIRANARELLLAFIATAFCIGAGISTTFLLQQIIDNIVPQNNVSLLYPVCIIAALIMGGSLYLGYNATGFLVRCSIKIESTLTSSYIGKIFRLPARFFESYSAGEITSRQNDIHLIRSFITGSITGMATSILTVAGALGIMFIYNSRLATITSIFIPLYWLLYKVSYKLSTKYGKEVAQADSAFETALLEGISCSSSLRHYNALGIVAGQIGEAHIVLMQKLQRSANAMNLLQTTVQGTSKLLICIIIAIGSFGVLHGDMTLGELVGFYSLCSFFTVPVNDLIDAGNSIAKARVACGRIAGILSLKEEEDAKGKISPSATGGDIVIKGLCFRHPGRAPLFNDFSATIKGGCTTLVRGESGCGKSTLMQLILGDYIPHKGGIYYGGTNILQLNREEWKRMAGYVEQRPRLLNTTILENITPGDENPCIEKVMEICRELDMEKMIERLPQGLLTIAGNGGHGLSGGECQKICIARAMYKNPSIFIFDEATSALDRQSADSVAACINSLRKKGKTIIYISHSRENSIIADNVVSI